MPDTCDVHFKLSRADFSSLRLGNNKFSIEAEHADVLEIYRECNERGEEVRELLDASSVPYLGSHGNGPDHGHAAFASDGERSLEAETDEHETYLVPADRNGVIDQDALACVWEIVEFRESVAVKLGLCSCCELPPEKCRS